MPVIPSDVRGVYCGDVDGDGVGPYRFFIAPTGKVSGNVRIPQICSDPIKVSGTVDPATNTVTFSAACGTCTISGTDGHASADGRRPMDGLWHLEQRRHVRRPERHVGSHLLRFNRIDLRLTDAMTQSDVELAPGEPPCKRGSPGLCSPPAPGAIHITNT